jgi:hypothetical protein
MTSIAIATPVNARNRTSAWLVGEWRSASKKASAIPTASNATITGAVVFAITEKFYLG